MPRKTKPAPALLPLPEEDCTQTLRVPLTALRLDPRNARRHDERNLKAIQDSLTAFGQQKPLVVTPEGLILAGNGTWEAAKRLGWPEIAVTVSRLDPEVGRAYSVADNRTAELALWDEEELATALRELQAASLPLPGWDAEELAALIGEPVLPGTGGGEEQKVTLQERFLVPPFSVFDARQGYWQARKRAWLALGIQSEIGRGEGVTWGDSEQMREATLNYYRKENNGLLGYSAQVRSPSNAAPGGSLRPATTLGANGKTQRGDGAGKPFTGQTASLKGGKTFSTTLHPYDGAAPEGDRMGHTAASVAVMELAGGFRASHQSGTSIFDPVLCEIAYRWFCPPGGNILDPFAGGSVRGIVAARLGRAYTGIDLREEQIQANLAQWALIGGGNPPPVFSPVPRVEECNGYRIVRDDETPGGSKVRALLAVLPTLPHEEVVYASPAYGFAQVALALAARATGKRATIFTAQRATLHPCTVAAQEAGARIELVPHGYLSTVQAAARKYCVAQGAALIPFGLDDPAYITVLAEVATATGEEPEEVWCVAGSGVLARALRQAWPQARLCVVTLGRKPELPMENVTVYAAPEAFEAEAKLPPPFPSCTHYDAKAWRFFRENASPGALFWNVAGAPDTAQLPAPPPQWLVGDSTALDTLLPPEATYDFLFTCPPYGDLERYSDDPRDISTLPHEEFLTAYRRIIHLSMQRLKEDRFAAICIGDIRDERGNYRNLVSATIDAFQESGATLYNEAILVTVAGSLPLRAGIPFKTSRKLGKTHQNVIFFCKGDARKATEACGPVEVTYPITEEEASGSSSAKNYES
jgi:hypothetical protein